MSDTQQPISDTRCALAIYLYGCSISLDDVSAFLEMTPTKARRKGHLETTSSGSEVVQKIGFWEFREETEADQICSSLGQMLAKISCDQVIGVHGIEKAEIDIFIPLEVGGTQNGFSFELPAKLLGRRRRNQKNFR